MQNPAEPVKPVSQASRSSQGATYSPWCASARGTMKPSSPSAAITSRSAASRGGPWSGRAVTSNDWNITPPSLVVKYLGESRRDGGRAPCARLNSPA